MADETLLMIGTRKGLWIGRSDALRQEWTIEGPHFPMMEIYSCLVDTRGDRPRLLVGASLSWTGPQVFSSDDLGQTWQEHPIGFPDGLDASVERVWQLVPGPEPEVVYAGTEPAAVFKSTDRGATFDLERALWDHPHRTEWGAGFGGQAFHTLLPHPQDSESVTVALSTGGVYQTHDGGASWEPRNHGIRAEFLPEGQQYPEFGQCVHKVTRHPVQPAAAVRAEPRRRLPLRRRGRDLGLDRRRAALRLRLPDRRAPARAGHRLRLPDRRRRLALPAGGSPARLALPRRRRDLGAARRGAARGLLRRGDARRDVHRHPRPGGPLLRRPQRQRLGLGRLRRDLARRSPPTCPT